MFYTMTFDAGDCCLSNHDGIRSSLTIVVIVYRYRSIDDNTGTTNQQDRPSILNFFS